jgi:hypothetical protein
VGEGGRRQGGRREELASRNRKAGRKKGRAVAGNRENSRRGQSVGDEMDRILWKQHLPLTLGALLSVDEGSSFQYFFMLTRCNNGALKEDCFHIKKYERRSEIRPIGCAMSPIKIWFI